MGTPKSVWIARTTRMSFSSRYAGLPDAPAANSSTSRRSRREIQTALSHAPADSRVPPATPASAR